KAKLIGFSSSDVTVMMRAAQNAAYDRVPLIPGKEQGVFEGMLFHLEKPTEYYVESNGVRSAKFTLAVVDLPTVQQMEMEYRFPAYTGLAARKAERRDVAAVRGPRVVLRGQPAMAAAH